MRFALLEIKILLARILSKYKFMKCAETQVNEVKLINIQLKLNLDFLRYQLFYKNHLKQGQ